MIDQVVDYMEELYSKDLALPTIKILIDGGLPTAVYSSTPNIAVEIIDLGSKHAENNLRGRVYSDLESDGSLMEIQFTSRTPGNEDPEERLSDNGLRGGIK